ncbi:UbiA family prenyltransferase [Nocardioides bigeumensis]
MTVPITDGARGTVVPFRPAPLLALLRAAHAGPTAAVTALATAVAWASGAAPGRVALVAAAVLTGQLSIGWSNDLLDLARDRTVGRTDKPLVTGEVSARWVRTACALAVVATVVLSLACGVPAGLWHLLVVASGWAYNLGLKATIWSWAPYAVAFGALPVFAVLARPGAAAPQWWLPAGGALLGVGAHLVNVLPDLDDDAATGVRGFPHRLGPTRAQGLAVVVLGVASVVVAGGAVTVALPVRVGALVLVAVLALVAWRGNGRVPFLAAIGIAAVDVLMLVISR